MSIHSIGRTHAQIVERSEDRSFLLVAFETKGTVLVPADQQWLGAGSVVETVAGQAAQLAMGAEGRLFLQQRRGGLEARVGMTDAVYGGSRRRGDFGRFGGMAGNAQLGRGQDKHPGVPRTVRLVASLTENGLAVGRSLAAGLQDDPGYRGLGGSQWMLKFTLLGVPGVAG
jgi:hypothetical protein